MLADRFKLRKVREEAGLNRTQMGQALGVGASAVANYENGYREIPANMIDSWYQTCGYTITIQAKRREADLERLHAAADALSPDLRESALRALEVLERTPPTTVELVVGFLERLIQDGEERVESQKKRLAH